MLAHSDTVGLAIAKGLGIPTLNLANLKIEFDPGSAVVITATYYVEEPKLVQVLEPLQDTKQYILMEVGDADHS